MSQMEHPINDFGLYITPEIAAYIHLYADRERPEIKALLEQEKFPAAVLAHHRNRLDELGCFDQDDAHECLWDMDIEHIYCNCFTGNVSSLDENTEGAINEDFDDDFIAYIPTSKEKSVFNNGYGSIDEIEQEFRKTLKGIIPDGFNIRPAICEIEGTDFS